MKAKEKYYTFIPGISSINLGILCRKKVIPFKPVLGETTLTDDDICLVNGRTSKVIKKGYGVPWMATLCKIELPKEGESVPEIFRGVSVCSKSEEIIDLYRGTSLARRRALRGIIHKYGWETAAEYGLIDTKHSLEEAKKIRDRRGNGD